MTAVIICRPSTFPLRRIRLCPTEGRRRRFSGYDAAWYGPRWTCLGCGDQFGDGERLPRPFRPRWRVDNIRAAKKVWDEAAGRTRDEHRAWLHAELFGDA